MYKKNRALRLCLCPCTVTRDYTHLRVTRRFAYLTSTQKKRAGPGVESRSARPVAELGALLGVRRLRRRIQECKAWGRARSPTRSPGPAAEASRAESATTAVDSSRPGAESTNESGTVLVFDRVCLLTPPLLVPQNCVQRVLCACSRHYISRWNRFCTDF